MVGLSASDTAARREARLQQLVSDVPYVQYLGLSFDCRGDELTGVLAYSEKLIGNPLLPALHGGVTAAFLEITAHVTLAWDAIWPEDEAELNSDLKMPKTIDFSVDYLRSGKPQNAFARARINRSGRRYASVHVEAWQENRSRLFAQATGHFLMPQ